MRDSRKQRRNIYLSGVLWSTEEKSVGACWRAKRELVQSHAFTASLQNTGTSSRGETEGCDRELGKFEQSGVVCDSRNNDDGLVFVLGSRVLVRGIGDDAGERDGRLVYATAIETFVDLFVEP